MKSLRRAILGGALAATAVAQDTRPASEPFVRIGERTSHPWPLTAKERLWVITADPFVCEATLTYFHRAVDALWLLEQALGATAESIDRSEWARAHPTEWAPLRGRLQDVAKTAERERQAESRPTEADIDGSEPSATARALRALTADPLWRRAPLPREAIDPETAALWGAFHALVRALWGETDLGWPGWLVRLAAQPAAAASPVSPWPQGEGLLPRVPDLLSRWTAQADPLLDAPAFGAGGVFTDLGRTTTHLRAALDRLTAGAPPAPSQRDALYLCVRGLLDEHEELARACARGIELCALLGSPDWRVVRTESVAGLAVRTRYGDQRSIVFGSPLGRSDRRDPFRALLLVSPRQQARLEALQAASQRALEAGSECAARLPGPRAAKLGSAWHSGGSVDVPLLRALRQLVPQDRSGELVVLEGDPERRRLRKELSDYRDGSLPGQFEASLAAPDAPASGGAADSWARVLLAGRGLHAVEFRLWVDGEWRWGRGAMASCEVQKDGAWRPLRECWRPR